MSDQNPDILRSILEEAKAARKAAERCADIALRASQPNLAKGYAWTFLGAILGGFICQVLFQISH